MAWGGKGSSHNDSGGSAHRAARTMRSKGQVDMSYALKSLSGPPQGKPKRDEGDRKRQEKELPHEDCVG